MDLISTIIVFGFLEIQSNNVPVDNKPYQEVAKKCSKSNLIKRKHVLVWGINNEFCFQQQDNVTRQSYFLKPLSTYLRVNKTPRYVTDFL